MHTPVEDVKQPLYIRLVHVYTTSIECGDYISTAIVVVIVIYVVTRASSSSRGDGGIITALSRLADDGAPPVFAIKRIIVEPAYDQLRGEGIDRVAPVYSGDIVSDAVSAAYEYITSTLGHGIFFRGAFPYEAHNPPLHVRSS